MHSRVKKSFALSWVTQHGSTVVKRLHQAFNTALTYTYTIVASNVKCWVTQQTRKGVWAIDYALGRVEEICFLSLQSNTTVVKRCTRPTALTYTYTIVASNVKCWVTQQTRKGVWAQIMHSRVEEICFWVCWVTQHGSTVVKRLHQAFNTALTYTYTIVASNVKCWVTQQTRKGVWAIDYA